MPKPMLNSFRVQAQTNSIADIGVSKKTNNVNDKMKLDRVLRKKRSKQYMDALCNLDSGGHTHNQHKAD